MNSLQQPHEGRLRGLEAVVRGQVPAAWVAENVFKNPTLRIQADPPALSFRGPATP
jgi:hypothetical protein